MIHNTERRIKMLENKTTEIDAYRNSIDFCIQDIDNAAVLKDLSHIAQNIWQNEKRHKRNHEDRGG